MQKHNFEKPFRAFEQQVNPGLEMPARGAHALEYIAAQLGLIREAVQGSRKNDAGPR